MLKPFTTATANRSTCSALRSSVSPACGVHTLFAVNLCGRGQFAIDLLAHLGFKRMVSCSFCDKRMRLKTRAYGTLPLLFINISTANLLQMHKRVSFSSLTSKCICLRIYICVKLWNYWTVSFLSKICCSPMQELQIHFRTKTIISGETFVPRFP